MLRTVMIAALAGLAASACAQNKAWDGGAGNADWFAGLNWDPDGVPGSGDAVLVQGATVFASAADIDVRSVLVDQGLVLESRSLYLAEPSTITNFTLQGCCTRSVVTQGLLTLNGNTSLNRGTIFGGPGGTRISGSATSADMVRVDGTTLTVAGTLLASGNVHPWGGGTLHVIGSLALRDGADLDEVSGGVTDLSPGGRIGHLASDANQQAFIDAQLEASSGLIYSDRGVLELRGLYGLEFTTLEATDGGKILLAGASPNEISDVRFEGDGTIELRNSNNSYLGALTVASESPGSTLMFGTVRLDGVMMVSGNAGLRSVRLESPDGTGSVGVSGLLDARSAVTEVPVFVLGGGTLRLDGTSLTPHQDIDVGAGGTLRMMGSSSGATVQRPSGDDVGDLFVEGLLEVGSGPCAFVNHRVQVPLELRPGGEVLVRDGQLLLDGGGSFTGGTLRVSVAEGCAAGLSVMGSGVTHFIAGPVRAVSESEYGFLTFGGSGHTLNVISTLTTEAGDIADLEFRGTIIGPGTIVHDQGTLQIGSGADLGADIVNNARLYVGASAPVRAEIRNEVDVDQVASLRFDGGSAVNDGVWTIRRASSDQTEQGGGGMFVNTGEYRVGETGAGGWGHTVAVPFDNRGTVVAEDAVAVFNDVAQIVGGTLTGGRWEVRGGGAIGFLQLVVRISGTDVRTLGGERSLPWLKDVGFIGDGADVVITEDTEFTGDLTVDGDGSLGIGDGKRVKTTDRLDIPSVRADIQGVIVPGLLPEAAVIEAASTVSGGRLIPGGEARAGGFDFVGDLVQLEGGQLLVDVGGEENTDAVTVTGSATLGGALRVTLIDGFVPEGGESYRLIDTLGGVFGDFSTLDLPDLPNGLTWEVYVGELFVGLSVVGGSCDADWNGDGTVNTLDFLAYLNDWSGGDPDADLNGDGSVNTLDFIAFLNAWVAGC